MLTDKECVYFLDRNAIMTIRSYVRRGFKCKRPIDEPRIQILASLDNEKNYISLMPSMFEGVNPYSTPGNPVGNIKKDAECISIFYKHAENDASFFDAIRIYIAITNKPEHEFEKYENLIRGVYKNIYSRGNFSEAKKIINAIAFIAWLCGIHELNLCLFAIVCAIFGNPHANKIFHNIREGDNTKSMAYNAASDILFLSRASTEFEFLKMINPNIKYKIVTFDEALKKFSEQILVTSILDKKSKSVHQNVTFRNNKIFPLAKANHVKAKTILDEVQAIVGYRKK